MTFRIGMACALIPSTIAILEGAASAGVCPAVGADTDCGTLITITKSGSAIASFQGPYDQIEDTLVGIVNNSDLPIQAIQVRSLVPIFSFDGDGICGIDPNTGLPFDPQPAGCPFGPTGYEGPGVTFSKISADGTTGTVNFNPPIPTGGGSAYFSLEENIQNDCSCADVLNNSVVAPTLGNPSSDGKNTSVSTTFMPQCGGVGGKPPTLADAAFYCGFVLFDWQQTFLVDPPPETTCETGSTVPLTAPPPYNDPPLKGWSYESPPSPVILPVYYGPFQPVSDDLSIFAHMLPTHNLATSTSVDFFDAPGDVCLPGAQDAATTAYADAHCGAPCGSTVTGQHNRAPAGSSLVIKTHLVGLVGELPGSTVQDTGIGFTWSSTFNGTNGGVSVKHTTHPTDPGSGSGGITITDFTGTTNYVYNGITITTVNGAPLPVCGNGTVETGEQCDDGAANGSCGDPCSSACALHWCGDGVADGGEQCDLGCQNSAGGSSCTSECKSVVPPSCALTAIIAGPPKQLQITVQSASVGLASVVVTESTNASVAVPAFSAGDENPLLVTATKIDQAAGATVALQVTDVMGQVTACDPVVPGDTEVLAATPSAAGEGAGCSVTHLGGRPSLVGLIVALALAGLGLFGRRRRGS